MIDRCGVICLYKRVLTLRARGSSGIEWDGEYAQVGCLSVCSSQHGPCRVNIVVCGLVVIFKEEFRKHLASHLVPDGVSL